MIRRISKHNDYRDYVMARPSRVVDEIYEIRYFVQGYSTEIACGFVNNGEILSVTIPSQMLALLPNGILMRRCKYRVEDSSYPDGYYDLVFEDSLDVWLVDYEGDGPQEYVTEDELASTLSSYATQNWVESQGYITSENLPSGLATQSWVSEQGYLTATSLDGYATQSWVENQGYAVNDPDDPFATESYVRSVVASLPIPSSMSDYATKSWVSSNFADTQRVSMLESVTADLLSDVSEISSAIASMGYDGEHPFATESYVTSYVDEQMGYMESDVTSWISESVSEVQSWVQQQGYYVEDGEDPVATQGYVDQAINDAIFGSDVPMPDLSSYATMSWVEEQGYAIEDGEDPFATESWVQSQGYLTSHQDLTGYATQSWVSSQGYLTSVPSEYATKSWVYSQGYLSSVPSEYVTSSMLSYELGVFEIGDDNHIIRENNLRYYATESWVSEQGYATQSWVASQGYLTSVPSEYATQSWVSSNFLSSSWVEDELSSYALTYNRNNDWLYESDKVYIGNCGLLFFDWIGDENGVSGVYLSSSTAGIYGVDSVTWTYVYEPFATQSWVQSQGYITVGELPSGLATQSWVESQGYLNASALSSALSGYATESYVDQAIEEAITGSDMPLPENVVEYDVNHPLIEEFGVNVDVLKRNEFDHDTYVITKGLVLGYEERMENGDVNRIKTIEIRDGLLMSVNYSIDGLDYYEVRDPYATESWVQSQGYITSSALSGYATQSWVSSQGYLTSVPSEYATQSWVSSQGYLTSVPSEYATKSWVSSQGYLTAVPSEYATQSWTTSNFLPMSLVWTGSQGAWDLLTAEQQATYIIALITE